MIRCHKAFLALVTGAVMSGAAAAAIVPGNPWMQEPLIDTDAGLGWQGFETREQGELAGFRMATSAEFQTLLGNAGYARDDVGDRMRYGKSGERVVDMPGLDAYNNPDARLISVETQNVLLGWAMNGTQHQLIEVWYTNRIQTSCTQSVFNCPRTVSSVAFFDKPGTLQDSEALWKVYSNGLNPNPPNFMMVRAVPEPASALMWAIGLGALAAVRRKVKAG